VDHNGRKVSLASQEAAHIVAAGDPIWCPLGVAPKSSVGGCSPAYTGFSGFFTGLGFWIGLTDPNKPGVIWVEDSYDSSVDDIGMSSITLDGSSLTHMAANSLAIKGGWNGISGSTITNAFDPSEFNASITIKNWHAPITISDIVVTGASVNPNDAYALYVQTDKGGITLNRVQVRDNYLGHLGGAHLDTSAAALGKPAPVTVNDSVFNNNYRDGLHLTAGGPVNIRNLTADYNGGVILSVGAYIDNWWFNPNQSVTLTGVNGFKSNYGTGLRINTFGAVSLNNITATGNNYGATTGYGVTIDNTHDSTPAIVKLTGTNLFNFNAQDGLYIKSNGNILLNNITSASNLGGGVSLDNCLKPGPNTACNTTARSVTFTGVNSFDHNGNVGADVYSSGPITISQVNASHNGDVGLILDNCAYDALTLHNCTTLMPFNVTINGPATIVNNSGTGLYITTTGAVSLKNITSSFNEGEGTQIFNNYHLLAPRSVTIGGTNVFNGNSYDGLYLFSYGAITLSNTTADDNGQLGSFGYGVYLDNTGYDSGLGGATVITRQPVKLTGINTFNNNYYNGLNVESAGAIFVSNLSASDNGTSSGWDGVYLHNNPDWYPNFVTPLKPYAASVTVSGFGLFENNGLSGMEIYSYGNVTLANLTANNNSVDGVLVLTYGFQGLQHTAPQNVTITGVNRFNNNGFGSGSGDGLFVQNDGKITISNLTANGNKHEGAFLNNYDWAWFHKYLGITLTGSNNFQFNQGPYALDIVTDGNAFLSHVNADLNSGIGVYMYATKNLTLVCGSAFNNNTGFYLWSGATMTLYGVNGFENITNNEVLTYTTLHRTISCP
jgi:hypothetical protein